METFRFKYDLENGTALFSTICGGVARMAEIQSSNSGTMTGSGPVDEIRWILKNQNNSEVFCARQVMQQGAATPKASIQSECRLRVGHIYETIKVSTPGQCHDNQRQPNQSPQIQAPCYGFARGTNIVTARGEVRVENLVIGDRLVTRDHGMQPLRWVGSSSLGSPDKTATAINFAEDAINNCRTMTVCPNQRVVLKGDKAMQHHGISTQLTQAGSIVNHETVRELDCCGQPFFRLLMDRHEIIYAEAAACDSFLPTRRNLSALDNNQRRAVFSVFPDLEQNPQSYGPLIRCHLRVTSH